jgi:hypothetical protein
MSENVASKFEQHVSIGLQSLIVMLVGWLVFTTNLLQVEVAKLRTEQTTSSQEITLLRQSSMDRYSATQASAELSLIRESLIRLDRRVEALER